MNKKSVTLGVALLMSGVAMAQTAVLGHVSDSEGTPIVNAAVRIGTRTVALTDGKGNFSLAKVPAGTKTLTVAYVGMKPRTMEISKNGTMNVVLEWDDSNLNEAIVVAYGTAKKASFTGSAATMSAQKLENRQVSDVSRALNGTVAGVQTTSNNGQPGTSATIRVRGFGSINATMSPLIVLDGVPYDGDISSINPNDIENVSVLKDAASAALYGARGANGVMLITTKKGKSGDAKVQFEGRWGVNSREIPNYDVVRDAKDYVTHLYHSLYNEDIYNNGLSAERAAQRTNPRIQKALGYPVFSTPEGELLFDANGNFNPRATLGYMVRDKQGNPLNLLRPDNWEKEIFRQNTRQEYNLSVSGGNERFNYYWGSGYLNDEGIIDNSGYKRYSTRLNADYLAKSWLKIGANLGYSYAQSAYPEEQTNKEATSSGNAFYIANSMAPVYPMYVRNPDGSFAHHPTTGQQIFDYGDGQTVPFKRNFMSISNPVGDLTNNLHEFLTDLFTGRWYANVMPLKGLTLTASLGLTVDNKREHSATSSLVGQSANSGGEAEQRLQQMRSLNQQYLATYKTSWGLHSADFLLGFERYDRHTEEFSANGQYLYRDGVWAVNNTINQRKGYGKYGEYITAGFFGRVNYDWAEKYFASFSFRRDGSSRFHPDHRWGNFWSLSGAWDVAKESFMKPYRWVDLLKVKASFGQQGNDAIGDGTTLNDYYADYAYIDQYKVTGANSMLADATLVYKGNKDLTWEKSSSFNVGVDFSLWNGKLAGSVEYFNRQTSDMLYNKPVALSNGYATMPMNIGSMRNSGVEIDLNSVVLHNSRLKWTVAANATFLSNKILKLHPDFAKDGIKSGSRLYQEGQNMFQLNLVEYGGVDPVTGKAMYWTVSKDSKTGATSRVLTDDWDDAYANARHAMGNLLPTVTGGFSSTLEAFGFDLSVSASFQLGGKVMDEGYQDLMHVKSRDVGQNWHKDIARAWTPQNQHTDVPRLDAGDSNADATSTRWLVSSDYLSLNNVTLGYTLPRHLVRHAKLASARLYAATDNLALFAARQGIDPRQSQTAVYANSYTAVRTVSFGVKLTF